MSDNIIINQRGKKFSIDSIERDESPAINSNVLVYHHADLAIAAPGTDIPVGAANGIEIISDFPFRVAVNDADEFSSWIQRVEYTGKVRRLRIVKNASTAYQGKLILLIDQPYFGAEVKRVPAVEQLQHTVELVQADTWSSGQVSHTVSLPFDLYANRFWVAYWIHSVYMTRSAGVIEDAKFLKTAPVGGNSLHPINERADNRLIYKPEYPIKISSPVEIEVYGSNELIDTDLDVEIQVYVEWGDYN